MGLFLNPWVSTVKVSCVFLPKLGFSHSNANNSLTQPQQQENNVTDNDTKQGIENLANISSNNEVVDDNNDKPNNNIPEIFDVRLSEGLNHLVFKCEDKNSNEAESMSFWINVLP